MKFILITTTFLIHTLCLFAQNSNSANLGTTPNEVYLLRINYLIDSFIIHNPFSYDDYYYSEYEEVTVGGRDIDISLDDNDGKSLEYLLACFKKVLLKANIPLSSFDKTKEKVSRLSNENCHLRVQIAFHNKHHAFAMALSIKDNSGSLTMFLCEPWD